eukprot:CAMPEP_0206420404 /NCGR_PEP_ID=MMETSP0324_2-20121206/822_1 /ASSEMBLY_ACC=CAM_ASM_000836 /TAXON_ID=2866 /ORGANISM="Crypthecodinium cohnii, Strain Seligo" /LENGTH=184 /DNA_ID=CAMNT_0053884281 /DNA_START=11 /DNA_END=561 /DNA_ORIENTATION=+
MSHQPNDPHNQPFRPALARDYDWLKPRGPPRPLIRNRQSSSVGTISKTVNPHVLPTKKGKGLRPDNTLWPVGAIGPSWLPPDEQTLQWRRMAHSAVQSGSSLGQRGSQSLPRLHGGRRQRVVERLPLKDHQSPQLGPWDSISQAPSVDGTPRQGSVQTWNEADSVETLTASRSSMPTEMRLHAT